MPTRPTTPAITAEEARKLAAEFYAQPFQIQPHLDRIHDRIREAATQGLTSIEDPDTEVRSPLLSEKELEAIAAVLEGEGYGIAWVDVMPPILVISWEA